MGKGDMSEKRKKVSLEMVQKQTLGAQRDLSKHKMYYT